MKPLVSVVIPTYNRAPDLRRSIGSVRAQTWDRWELLVVDKHSTDDTDQVIADFNDPRIRLLKVQNEGVIGASRNVGISTATGEYVALLDSDDWWTSRKLELSVQALEAGADVVYHDLLLAYSPAQRIHWSRARTRRLASPVLEDLIQNGNALNNSSVVVRRTLLEGIGGFSEERGLISWEDYDLWLRLAGVTERFHRLDDALGYYWVGGGNVSTPLRTIRNLEQIRNRYIAPRPGHESRAMPAWYHYALGRAHYHLREHSIALAHMREALRGKLPWRKRLKAILTMAASTSKAMSGRAQPQK